MVVGSCPECRGAVTFEVQPILGQRAVCPSCQAVLEVVVMAPVELDWSFEEPFADAWTMEETVVHDGLG